MCPTGTFVPRFSGLVNVPSGHILPDRPPHPRNLIGPNLRRLRRAAVPKVSQEDLCGRVATYGVTLTRTQVTKIEAGRRPVFDYEAAAIAKALRVSLLELFDDPPRAHLVAFPRPRRR